jgi:DNA-binding response OmpR family regulator
MNSGGRVLILEDEPILGFALEDMLSEIGDWEVELCTRLEEAHSFLNEGLPVLAILDVNIHGQLSYPIADRLLAAGVPYIFATGYGDLTHPQVHLEAITVTKPYSLAHIADAVGAAVPEGIRGAFSSGREE